MSGSVSVNKAWERLIEKYDILREIEDKGTFKIKASQIKEFKEPRLMAKWDSSDSLPEVFRKYNVNILPDSRNSYVLGDFLLYEEIPELTESVNKMEYVEPPEYESLDAWSISSEANAINMLILSGILDDFLEESGTAATFNGRMGTGEFDFEVNTVRGIKQRVSVKNAQCEIDGGFENENSVIVMEAKNVLHEDFHIRQLYYPYRLWKKKVTKPIRLIFSVYTNMIFRLFEYRFLDENDYSSIECVKMKCYSLQETAIEIGDLIDVRRLTAVKYSDDQKTANVPFIQANSFERVISLLENMYDNPMTVDQIAELMNFDPRQSDYYINAGKYLGLFDKKKEDGIVRAFLTDLGNKVLLLNYKERQLKFVELMLQHQIFADCFDLILENNGETPSKMVIEDKMRYHNVCNSGQIARRASSVQGWLKWIFNLKDI